MSKTDSYQKIEIPPGGYSSGPKSPSKTSKRSARRKNRGFVSLEVSSRKHRRAKKRIYLNPDSAHRDKGKINYHFCHYLLFPEMLSHELK